MTAWDRPATGRRLRAVSTLALMAALGACSQGSHQSAIEESARYAADRCATIDHWNRAAASTAVITAHASVLQGVTDAAN